MERKIREIRYGETFLKHAARLPKKIVEKVGEKEQIFRKNAFHPILRTHKLHGKNKEIWAFWIDYTHRIKFIFLGESDVLFLDIGTHNIYR